MPVWRFLKDEGPDRLTCYRWRHTAASSLLMRAFRKGVVTTAISAEPIL